MLSNKCKFCWSPSHQSVGFLSNLFWTGVSKWVHVLFCQKNYWFFWDSPSCNVNWQIMGLYCCFFSFLSKLNIVSINATWILMMYLCSRWIFNRFVLIVHIYSPNLSPNRKYFPLFLLFNVCDIILMYFMRNVFSLWLGTYDLNQHFYSEGINELLVLFSSYLHFAFCCHRYM